MPDELLDDLERARICFEPQDPVRQNSWLFGPDWQVAELLSPELKYVALASEEQREKLDQGRTAALRKILDQRGWEGILELVSAAEVPGTVGFALADWPEYETRIVPDLLASTDGKTRDFARGYASGRFQAAGWAWLDRIRTQGWAAEQDGRLLEILPFERRTWQLAATWGEEAASWYWEHAHAWYPGSERLDEAREAIGKFLAHRRPAAATHIISMALHDKQQIEPGLLMDVLQGWLDSWKEGQAAERLAHGKYDIEFMFRTLQDAAECEEASVDLHRLAGLEWAFLGILDGISSSPATLHRLLCDDPDFFVQILGFVFPPQDAPAETPEPSETERIRAQNAYQLLMSWREIPGVEKAVAGDDNALADWLREARRKAQERGLLEVCDYQLGKVFAHAPGEPDGSWPCIIVRDVLEDIGAESEEVFKGLRNGIFNKRGVYTKSLREGGTQERALAEKYRNFAASCHIDWPRTADAFRRVAQAYEDDARREDAKLHDD